MWPRPLALLAVALMCALHTAPASAATITVGSHPEPVFGDEVVYHAAPGERNDVTLQEVELGGLATAAWEVRDPGAVITASGPCRVVDEHVARCGEGPFGVSSIGGYRLRLGDGDDRLRVAQRTATTEVGWVVADGGPGDDVLFGGRTDYVLGDRLFGAEGVTSCTADPGRTSCPTAT